MIDTKKYKGEITHLHCHVETVRWAVNWWNETWGGVPEETLEYLGMGD